jgi:hypothetical protein
VPPSATPFTGDKTGNPWTIDLSSETSLRLAVHQMDSVSCDTLQIGELVTRTGVLPVNMDVSQGEPQPTPRVCSGRTVPFGTADAGG